MVILEMKEVKLLLKKKIENQMFIIQISFLRIRKDGISKIYVNVLLINLKMEANKK